MWHNRTTTISQGVWAGENRRALIDVFGEHSDSLCLMSVPDVVPYVCDVAALWTGRITSCIIKKRFQSEKQSSGKSGRRQKCGKQSVLDRKKILGQKRLNTNNR